MRHPIFRLLGICLVGSRVAAQGPGTAQLRDTARVTIGEATIQVDYDAMVSRDTVLVGKSIPLGLWMLGTVTPARLTSSATIRIDDREIPAGSYSLWVLVSPDAAALIVNRNPPKAKMVHDSTADIARIPLTIERGDSALVRLRTTLARSTRTASTIVMTYEKSRSKVIDRYNITTAPPDRPDVELVIEWQWLRWSVPVWVVARDATKNSH